MVVVVVAVVGGGGGAVDGVVGADGGSEDGDGDVGAVASTREAAVRMRETALEGFGDVFGAGSGEGGAEHCAVGHGGCGGVAVAAVAAAGVAVRAEEPEGGGGLTGGWGVRVESKAVEVGEGSVAGGVEAREGGRSNGEE